jgi:adenosyl cobinamide kinase/adenosyl cobinamide phosphate guanylyltransferase
MIFVTGGNSQGKLEFVMKTFAISSDNVVDGSECALEDAFRKPVLNLTHILFKRMLNEDLDLNAFIEAGLIQNPDIIIICDEVGCGIVPIRQEERTLREKIGRSQCMLAGRAEKVYRVCCGIPELIKGE